MAVLKFFKLKNGQYSFEHVFFKQNTCMNKKSYLA